MVLFSPDEASSNINCRAVDNYVTRILKKCITVEQGVSAEVGLYDGERLIA